MLLQKQPITNNVSYTALENYRDLLGVKDLMEIFNVSRQTIYKEIHSGKFGPPINTIGRAIKIPKVRIIQQFFNA